MAKKDSFGKIFTDQNRSDDSILSEFEREMRAVMNRIRKEMAVEFDKGFTQGSRNRIVALAGNRRLARRTAKLLEGKAATAGMSQVIDKFVKTFDGQFVFFDRVIAQINRGLKRPLPDVEFGIPEKLGFEGAKLDAKQNLAEVMDRGFSSYQQQVVLAIGGSTPKQLSEILVRRMKVTVSEAAGLADTSIASFYRTITDNGFQIIESDLPEFDIRYLYEGPLDVLTRPFCKGLLQAQTSGRNFTRNQINGLDNGQIPNVFVSGGGHRCRHQWAIDVEHLRAQQEKRRSRPKINSRSGSRSLREIKQQLRTRSRLVERDVGLQFEIPSISKSQLATIQTQVTQEVRRRADAF